MAGNDGVLGLEAAALHFGGVGFADLLMGINMFQPEGAHSVNGGYVGRRRAANPTPAAPRIVNAPLQNDYRVELTPELSTSRCAVCGMAIQELTTRIGMRPTPQTRHDATRGWRWHHLNCLPAAQWHEARVRGVSNMRQIPPADQARVREHMQTHRR